MKRRDLAGALTVFTVCFLMAGCGARTHTLELPATAVWQSTDIEIPDDSSVLIEAVGTISPNGHVHVDANGTDREDWIEKHNMHEEMNHCALVAKIGAGGDAMLIGVSKEIEVSKGGVLILGINDSHPENNEGSLNVTVTIRK